ncbi:hypothetical protein ACHAWO_002918 [Cyclotella atomus]|uniref:Uncharacterized protein n=1 Tax=Cyclotella atomus TaxID=382360 RepID=A0ABD3QH54_9STRA
MPNKGEPTLVTRKIAVLGFRAVGKTSLTNAFVSGTFSDNYDPTIENTHHKTIRFRKVHFATDIIDTAGMKLHYKWTNVLSKFSIFASTSSNQDEYSSISRNASVGVHGYALVFSITSRSSFENIIKINDALLNALGDALDVPRILVGSMKDLGEEREVSSVQAQKLAESLRIPYMECSSKTGENVAEVFHTLLKEIEKDDGLLNDQEEEKCIIL